MDPAPIQSRMRVFNIKQPDPDSMLPVIESIYSHVINNKAYGQLLDAQLDDAVTNQLLNQSPRAGRLAIEEGAFKAIRNQQSSIISSDLPLMKKEKNRVGFI